MRRKERTAAKFAPAELPPEIIDKFHQLLNETREAGRTEDHAMRVNPNLRPTLGDPVERSLEIVDGYERLLSIENTGLPSDNAPAGKGCSGASL